MTAEPALDSTARHLRRVLYEEQASAQMPSVVAGVIRDTQLIWWGSRGRAVDKDSAIEPTPDTQYRIGSITKTVTAILVLQLRDEGLLDLADPVTSHLPDSAFGAVPLRQLLSHAAGLPAEPPGPWWERTPGRSYPQLAAGLHEQSSPLPAGRQYHYSNLAFGLLGEIVARRRRSSWWDAVRAHLLEPLGLGRTTYFPEPPAAHGFSVDAFAGTLTDEPAHDSGAMAPAGQLWSSLSDLCRYAAFLADPDPGVLSPDTMREMATLQSGAPEDGMTAGYGLGLRLLNAEGRTLVGHTGSMPGFLAGLYVDRERRSAAICLGNGTAGMRCEGLPMDLLATVERYEPALPPPWVPNDELPESVADVLGMWFWGETPLVLSYADGELTLARPADSRPAYRFCPAGTDTFVGVAGYHTGETLRVLRNAEGGVHYLECATFVYTRHPYDTSAPIPGGVPRNLSSPG